MFFRRIVLLALPARIFAERYLAAFLMLAALTLMLITRHYADNLSSLRSAALSTFSPVLSVMAEPVRAARSVMDNMHDIAAMRVQNEQLRAENEKLQDWYNNALRLQSENRSLKDLLNMKQDAELSYVTARVIADSGSSYMHSVIVEIPDNKTITVRRGMAVLSGQGLVGRVIDLDNEGRYARILLITDISSRIPVLMENSRQRAVAAGDNSGSLFLDHLPEQTQIEMGERVITSGYDGIFPAGLPVARVTRLAKNKMALIQDGGVTLQPLSNLDQLDVVRLVDYGTIDTSLRSRSPVIVKTENKKSTGKITPAFAPSQNKKIKSR